jgi:dephospho-CoA kinase
MSETTEKRSPTVVGLTGGVGSGKSTVARLLGGRGALVLDADAMAREVLDSPAMAAELRSAFGEAVIDPRGGVDREALAGQVFGPGSRHRRERLEALVHPEVRRRLAAALEAARRQPDPPAVVVLDVPLLLEGPLAAWCDLVIFVDAPADVRSRRTREGRAWDQEEHRRREAAQLSVEAKRAGSGHVIRNGGSLEDLEAQIDSLLSRLDPERGAPPPEARKADP